MPSGFVSTRKKAVASDPDLIIAQTNPVLLAVREAMWDLLVLNFKLPRAQIDRGSCSGCHARVQGSSTILPPSPPAILLCAVRTEAARRSGHRLPRAQIDRGSCSGCDA